MNSVHEPGSRTMSKNLTQEKYRVEPGQKIGRVHQVHSPGQPARPGHSPSSQAARPTRHCRACCRTPRAPSSAPLPRAQPRAPRVRPCSTRQRRSCRAHPLAQRPLSPIACAPRARPLAPCHPASARLAACAPAASPARPPARPSACLRAQRLGRTPRAPQSSAVSWPSDCIAIQSMPCLSHNTVNCIATQSSLLPTFLLQYNAVYCDTILANLHSQAVIQ